MYVLINLPFCPVTSDAASSHPAGLTGINTFGQTVSVQYSLLSQKIFTLPLFTTAHF